MKLEIIAAYLKGFSKLRRMACFFWNIFFRYGDLYYANEQSDDVIGGFTKTVRHSITNISRNIKAVFFKQAPETNIIKEGK